ncbi:MAG: cupin domain-containing protein [Rhodocyclaceae bacterium]|nr:cupin domain-containing protein [Rhodocyclaceae bacterium]
MNPTVTTTLINADFSQQVVMPPARDNDWVASPCAGVWRHQLDRIGNEIARATSIVRYSPGAQFSPHTHDGGEEFLVLQGTFSDENGDYPAGTYVRNPPGSRHTPFTRDGCTIFAKLWQFSPGDRQAVKIDTSATEWRPGLVPGLSVMPLHEFDGISSALVKWAPHTHFSPHVHPGGEEILVLQGVFRDEHGEYPAGTWLRSPRWSKHTPFTGTEGAIIYVKVGHLGAPLLQPRPAQVLIP